MHFLLLTALSLLASATAQSTDARDALVEIERQRLIKFPDELTDEQRIDETKRGGGNKRDESERILQEIDKINQALGYVKKQPAEVERAPRPRLPTILDSSHYLFPKPAYHPFHEQHHQMEGSNGETILVPSIRAVKLDKAYAQEQPSKEKPAAYNVPPLTKAKRQQEAAESWQAEQEYLQKLKRPTSDNLQYFYRPNEVHVPAPQSAEEQQQLPTHFVIPVRLYKLNKAEYMQHHAPQEFRVKGYKIVGDIDNFYGKAKNKVHKGGKLKSTPKYHLFFLPRELALNADATLRQKTKEQQQSDEIVSSDTGSREEKYANRPYKLQASASATSTASGNKNSTTSHSVTSNTQIVKKRIVPKPTRDRETQVSATSSVQKLPSGGTATTSSTIHITPPPQVVRPTASQQNSQTDNGNSKPNPNQNLGFFNRLSNSNSNTNANNNANGTNVIKNAFQNLFKLPFRQEARPDTATETQPHLESVPLQTPQKLFFNAQSLMPSSFYNPPAFLGGNNNNQLNSHSPSKHEDADDDEDNSYSTENDEPSAVESDEEKGLFGKPVQHVQETQKEAIKQGGIIIQRLKVRKGGIAIAGPGGVATAGSGGTAIVGPGGYALTHPRSLTIAGPGAKIIAIPASVDLKDALERTNLHQRSFPEEGKVVATGPTVYYSPETGTAVEI